MQFPERVELKWRTSSRAIPHNPKIKPEFSVWIRTKLVAKYVLLHELSTVFEWRLSPNLPWWNDMFELLKEAIFNTSCSWNKTENAQGNPYQSGMSKLSLSDYPFDTSGFPYKLSRPLSGLLASLKGLDDSAYKLVSCTIWNSLSFSVYRFLLSVIRSLLGNPSYSTFLCCEFKCRSLKILIFLCFATFQGYNPSSGRLCSINNVGAVTSTRLHQFVLQNFEKKPLPLKFQRQKVRIRQQTFTFQPSARWAFFLITRGRALTTSNQGWGHGSLRRWLRAYDVFRCIRCFLVNNAAFASVKQPRSPLSSRLWIAASWITPLLRTHIDVLQYHIKLLCCD